MSEYDLKKSEKIGQLYPVLVDSKGNVIDGFHRLEADPRWRTEKLSEINTEEQLLVARCVANWHRRQVPWEEKEEWINGLARIYKRQGLKVSGRRLGSAGASPNEIEQEIVKKTGLTPYTVRQYLSDEFKQKLPSNIQDIQKPRKAASEVIISITGDRDYGKQLVDRHREEVEQELRPRVEREVRNRIEEEIKPKVKEELSRDVEFIREAIEKAPEVLPTLPKETIEQARKLVEPKEMGVKEGIVYTIGEYECPNCKRHYWIRCNGKKDWIE